jgi:hypothetical protein
VCSSLVRLLLQLGGWILWLLPAPCPPPVR